MNSCRWILAMTLVVSIVTIPVLAVSASELQGTIEQKRVIVLSKESNAQKTDVSLKKYLHKKVKVLKNFKGAEVIIVDDTEFQKLKSDSSLEVFEDVTIKVSMPKIGNKNKSEQISWGVKRVEADNVWSQTTGKGIKVAVIDSGVDKHKDLRENFKGEFNAIEPGKAATDDFGHGTHVAGVIAAKDNQIGVVGIAPEVDLYAVKVLDSYGSGYLSDLVEGIEWCINNQIQVVNLSLEVETDLPLLQQSVRRALDAGIMVVSAAGNTNGQIVAYPAAYEGVISVSALDKNDYVAPFSAIGKIDFCAPGVDILSTYLKGDYEVLSGTSMAAPHVTGVLALMLADSRNDINYDGVVSSQEVKEMLYTHVEDIGVAGYDIVYGNGVLKAVSDEEF